MSAATILSSAAQSFLNQTVHLKGHVSSVRDLGNLTFVVLRDRSGLIQLVVEDPKLAKQAAELSLETPVAVTGEPVAHPSGKGVEIKVTGITPLAAVSGGLPVEINKNAKVDNLALPTMLDYRPLTVRNEKVRAVFRLEAAICKAFSDFLWKEGFTEIHSPKIVATGTEGGANLFKLDYFGKNAFLAQSPQFYKQIMVGAFERVYEVGPVYRAEEHDTTRHLNEYVSLDFEMGFIESEQCLISMQTRLLRHIFAFLKNECESELALFGAVVPEFEKIPQIRHADALKLLTETYGWKSSDGSLDLDASAEVLLCEHFKKTAGCELVYVTHYPWSVRPFYAMPEEPGLSRSFDLLFRGLEITTGGQRIHEYEMLRERIASRGLDPDSFGDYLQCFKYGMPPHGGLAIGLERLAKQLLGLPNVKLAALFPRDRNRLTP